MKFGQETVAFRYYILFKKSFAWIILNKMPFYTIPLTQMQLVPFSHPQKSSNKKSKAAFLINLRSRSFQVQVQSCQIKKGVNLKV